MSAVFTTSKALRLCLGVLLTIFVLIFVVNAGVVSVFYSFDNCFCSITY